MVVCPRQIILKTEASAWPNGLRSRLRFTGSRVQSPVEAICWLVVLRLNVPVNNFSVMSGRSHRFLVINQYFRGVKCFAQGHNTAEVGLEPRTSRSGVRHSTTEPPRSPPLEARFFPNLNGSSLHRAFHVHPSIISK